MPWYKNEVDVARAAIAAIKADGWEIYQEVPYHGRTCDIVAVRDGNIWAIEAKRALNLKVVDQAMNHRLYAHYIGVCVPRPARDPTFALDVMAHYGIGVVMVDGPETVATVIQPEFADNPMNALRDALREGHKTFAEAGTNSGRSLTPFRQTALQVRALVFRSPGLTVRQVVRGVDHHYRSNTAAARGIVTHCKTGIIGGVRLRVINGTIRLYPFVRGCK